MKKALIVILSMTLSGCFGSMLSPSKEVIEKAIESCKSVSGTYQLTLDQFTCKFGENEVTTHVSVFPTLTNS